MEYIKIKDAIIPLKVQTYNNSKSLKLYFKNGILKITKTPYTSQATVDALIEAYKEEIYENFIDIQAKAKGKWSDRKEMLYKGEKYNIVKEYNEKNIIKMSVNENEKIIKIELPIQIKGTEIEEDYILKAMRKMLKNATELILQERLPYWSKITKIEYSKVIVKDMTSKFGSCMPYEGLLKFTSRLAMLKPEGIDAVVVHELCHMVQPNHSNKFYELIEKYLPNYKEIDKYLKSTSIK